LDWKATGRNREIRVPYQSKGGLRTLIPFGGDWTMERALAFVLPVDVNRPTLRYAPESVHEIYVNRFTDPEYTQIVPLRMGDCSGRPPRESTFLYNYH